MRFNCEVAVQNWSVSQGSVDVRKTAIASISVGRKTVQNECRRSDSNVIGTAFLLISTSNNIPGAKYKIHGNIAKIFGKFVREGKATIRFKEPTHELCLSKADPPSLYKFLAMLKALNKDNENVKLPLLTTTKRSDVKKVKTDLMIFGSNAYLKSAGTFPENLQKLSLVGCRLVRFDIRILALKHLVELNLSQNKLKELDVSLNRLKFLKTLNLSSNLLTRLSSKICRTTKLVMLDLSNNQLSCLPIAFGTMTSLVSVKLNDNQLSSLPSNLEQLINLRSLWLNNNQLAVIPKICFRPPILDTLDISGNRFRYNQMFDSRNRLSLTLQELAAKAIKMNNMFYNHHMVGKYLCDYLDSAKICSYCRVQWCLSCIYVVHPVDAEFLSQQVVLSDKPFVPLEIYLCSVKCFNLLNS